MAEEKYLKAYSKSALGNYLVSNKGIKQNCITFTGTATVLNLTLTDEESGTTFMLDTAASGAAAAITLPAVAAGLNYKFVCKEDTPSQVITIAAGSAIIDLIQKDAGGDAANSTAGTAVSNIVIGVTATQGDSPLLRRGCFLTNNKKKQAWRLQKTLFTTRTISIKKLPILILVVRTKTKQEDYTN